MLTVGSLFTGIGGIDLGLEQTGGFETKWVSEIDPLACSVLAARWPHVPNLGDVRAIRDPPCVDVITAGFPCQPSSLSGRRLGNEDPRWLWPEVARLLRFARRYVLLENVPGLRSKGMGEVLADLSARGFDAEWESLPASSVGAPQRRDRLWIVAYPASIRRNRGGSEVEESQIFTGQFDRTSSAPGRTSWEAEPQVDRVVDGLPDRLAQIRALGNAVVPQVAEVVGRFILSDYERRSCLRINCSGG